MRKVFIAISILLLSSGSQLAAQTITDFNSTYKEFVQIVGTNGDKAQMYDALYRCYTATYAVIAHAEKTSSDYTKAVANMKNLIDFLPNAAAYSSNNQNMDNAIKFARAYVDVVSMHDFDDGRYTTQTAYSQLSYFAAANLVNNGQYKEAIPYLQAYLRSGDEKFRKSVFVNLIKACSMSNNYQLAIITLDQASDNYPNDYDIISSAVNLCIDHKDNENLQKFVNKGFTVRPDDETLLNIQGKLHEENHHFEQALDIYKKLQVTHPKALDVLKHLAIDNYNIGVQNYNQALKLQEGDTHIEDLKNVYKEYFSHAVDHIKDILVNDPLSLKYTQALVIAYKCIGDEDNFNTTNNKLASLGGGKVESNFIPQIIEFSGDVKANLLAYSSTNKQRTEPSTEQRTEQSAEQSEEQSIEQSTEQSIEQSEEQNEEQGEEQGEEQSIEQPIVKQGVSDVDESIPENPTSNTRTFAVVIANQNYSNVADVPMALNDGQAFSKYCEKTLGMPAENVRYYPDASYGTMLRAVRDIKNIANAFNGDIKIVFYYAGHGIPNEATKDAYLLPTDADGTQTEGCYSLNKLYEELGSTKAKGIVLFLDACFSGSKREEGMLASARGVALKAKQEDPRGNMVVFTAASGDETAFPYSAKGHGLFTYFLLKKLQETNGGVSLGELFTYISENVKQQSIVRNRKMQTPTAIPSTSLSTSWEELKLK